jgi:hypothetical protein
MPQPLRRLHLDFPRARLPHTAVGGSHGVAARIVAQKLYVALHSVHQDVLASADLFDPPRLAQAD